MAKTLVVDSDSIFAIYNPNDPLNVKATDTLQKLIIQGFQLIYPTSVLFEIISLFQRVLPTPTVTAKLIDMIKNDEFFIYVIDSELLKESAVLFKPGGSKRNTLIDCSVAAVAKKIKAEGVFSYDEFYKKQGIKLAEDIIDKR